MWPWAKMKDAGIEVFDGPHATPPKAESGPIFLGISNLSSGRLNTIDVEYIQEDYFPKWTRRVTPQAGDIVFSYETRLGEAAMIPEGLRCCLGRRMGLLRCDRSVVEPRFLLYLYLSQGFQEFLQSRTLHGSTVDRLPVGDFPDFEIPVPPLLEQRGIASVLGALDDKIELNRQMNRTLEEMAAALFKSWFVDFDPIHAKAEGRRPFGMDDATAALFPDRFVETEEGMVPEGWEKTVFSTFADLNPESWSKEQAPDHILYLDLANVKWGEVGEPAPYPFTEAPSRARRVLRDGDALMGTVRPANGSHGLVVDPHDTLTGSTGFAVLRPLKADYRYFNYEWVRRPEYIEYLAAVAGGSAYPAFDPSLIMQTELWHPGVTVISAYHRQVDHHFRLSHSNREESRTLADLRDTLLPKLLSGEIRLEQAEKAVEGAL